MDPVILSRSEILSDEDGKCVSKVLDGQIGKGINFHCCRKGSHDGSAKTVNQTLHCQDSQVHNGLLHTGQSEKLVISFIRLRRRRMPALGRIR